MRYVLALPADEHCGSSLGLIKDKPFQLHDGGTYTPSKAQKLIYKQWIECWKKIALERKKSRLIVINDGDAVEGIHHETTQIISCRTSEHKKAHADCMDDGLNIANFNPINGDKIYYMSGTEEHVGNGSQLEEDVAEDLMGVVPVWEKTILNDKDEEETVGRYTWDHLSIEVNKVLVDVAHHGGAVGRKAWTTSDGLRSTLKSIYFECLELNRPIPRYWVRAHLHNFVHATYEGERGIIEGIMLPSFQLKTGYVYKKFGAQVKPADVGMVYIVVNDDGSSYWRCERMMVEQDTVQKL
jgi:hypothetical protein